MPSSLSSAISAKFITAIGRNGSALTGSSSAIKSGDTDSVKTSLRTAAQAYASAYQGLNALISYVNLSVDSLDKLDKITDKLINLTKEAEASDSSSQARTNADLRFKRLGKEFRDIVENSKIQDQNYLTTDGLGNLFNIFGLDKDNSQTIGALFKRFDTPSTDTAIASEEEQATRPYIPGDAYVNPVQVRRTTPEYDSLFDSDRHINNRPDAYRMEADLKELKKQIGKNKLALKEATQVVSDNMKLAQGAGFAFLDVSNLQNIGDAEEAARLVQREIRRNVPAALAQAENLEPMAVAMLVLAQNNAGSSS